MRPRNVWCARPSKACRVIASRRGYPRCRCGSSFADAARRAAVVHRRGRDSRAAPDIVTATIDADNYAVLAPRQGSALLVLSSDMLRHGYHLRYELLEFAVITLAVRTLGLVPLHAACVSLRGRGVLLIGDSGSGKSTLSLHAAAAGLELVSEDNLFVEPRRLRAASLPNYLYVRMDTPGRMLPDGLARHLARAALIRRRSGVRKRALDLRRAGLAVAGRAPRIVATILLSVRPARAGRLLIRQSSSRALARLRAMQAYAAARPEWPHFARTMARLPCFELRRGAHPLEAIAVLKALLRDERALHQP